MKKGTVEFVVKLLNSEVDVRRARMMDCIDNGLDPYIKERIDNYREALYARDDFRDFVDDQEFEEC